jgi:hypothetical protein
MKKKNIILILVLFGILSGSCDITRTKRLGKTNYYLVDGVAPFPSWGLYYEDAEINSFTEAIVAGNVIDVYWNEQYILATQYALKSDSIKGYYIVKMLPLGMKKGTPCEKTGPLSKEEYEQKKQELQLNEKEMRHIHISDY